MNDMAITIIQTSTSWSVMYLEGSWTQITPIEAQALLGVGEWCKEVLPHSIIYNQG